jgi:aryl-alcohol dehydrogenase-like predicted oxidoreductase
MQRRYLGRTGIHIGPLTLGCMMFGGRTTADEAQTIIDRAIDAGINFLGTANVYNDGKSEEFVAIKHRKAMFSPREPAVH